MHIEIGLLGFGTVGTGVYKLLELRREKIKKRTGFDVSIKKILVRNPQKQRNVLFEKNLLTTNPEDILLDKNIDIIVEVMGGVHPAKEYIEKAIINGKDVVTANKELMAKHGLELLKLAESHGVSLKYEATVAGAIPIIRQIKQFTVTDDIDYIGGILNGTCNFILTQMSDNKWDYYTALKEAQRLGYAEADPSYDVLGYDSMFKLKILIREIFGAEMDDKDMEVEGIANISRDDVEEAERNGCKIKLYAWAKKEGDKITAGVGPKLFDANSIFSRISGVENAVLVKGDGFGQQLFVGYGAGQMPTGDAVLSDILDVINDYRFIRKISVDKTEHKNSYTTVAL